MTPVPRRAAPPSPARRLRDALEPIATQGWWSRAVRPRLDRLGVSRLEAYAWGRAAALGEPSPAVVVATFGVFEPSYLAGLYERGRAAVARDDILAARAEGAAEGLAAVLGDQPEVAALGDTLLTALGGAAATARPLFAGLRELPMPPSPHGRLWRAAELYREHRGDGHLAACVAAGLDPVEMNLLTEVALGYGVGEYSATRGFAPDAVEQAVASLAARGWLDRGGLTDDGWAARTAIEDATDEAQDAVVAAIGRRLEEVIAGAESFSAQLIEAKAFPDDARKRAAG